MSNASVFIAGQFRPASAHTAVIEAATEQQLGLGAAATESEIDDAVTAARTALPGWAGTPAGDRAGVLRLMADALQKRAAGTQELCSRENGMPIRLSKGANGMFPAVLLRYYADLLDRTAQEEVRPAAIGHTIVRRDPVGVVAAITPWNYPQALAIMKIAPALAAGCTMVLKAAPETALDALVFAEAAQESGLPAGVLNIIAGGAQRGCPPGLASRGRQGGLHRVDGRRPHHRRDLRPATASGHPGTGRQIGRRSSSTTRIWTPPSRGCGRPVRQQRADLSPELADPGAAIPLRRGGRRGGRPGRRSGGGRPAAEIHRYRPLVSRRQQQRVLEYIEIGKSEAKLVAGGAVPADQPRGWFVSPTVFADVDNSARIAQEEIFGPVLTVIPYGTDQEAVDIANDSEFGLGGTVWSPDVDRATDIARAVHTGTIGVNEYQLDVNALFGGVKASGLGRELGPEGLAAYQSLKSIYRVGPHLP